MMNKKKCRSRENLNQNTFTLFLVQSLPHDLVRSISISPSLPQSPLAFLHPLHLTSFCRRRIFKRGKTHFREKKERTNLGLCVIFLQIDEHIWFCSFMELQKIFFLENLEHQDLVARTQIWIWVSNFYYFVFWGKKLKPCSD